jgi:F-type H+-transporting ATPase subunit epsilon
MELLVLTPEKEYFKGQIKSVTVPGKQSPFQVLKDHAPLISALVAGEVKIEENNGNIIKFGIDNGYIEVLDNELAILVQNVKSVD